MKVIEFEIRFRVNPKMKDLEEAFGKAFKLLSEVEKEGFVLKAKLPEKHNSKVELKQ